MSKIITMPVTGNFTIDSVWAKNLEGVGGIGTFLLSKDFIEQERGAPVNKIYNDFLDEVPLDECFILISSGLKAFISDEHLQALLHHEEGHILSKHVTPSDIGVIIDIEKEIEADNYAASIVGAKTLGRALLGSLKWRARQLAQRFGGVSEETEKSWVMEMVGDPVICRRLANLKKLHET